MHTNRYERIDWVEGVHFKQVDPFRNNGAKYQKIGDTSHRGPHGKTKTIPNERLSDGATCAKDLCPEAFFLHDEICIDPFWDDGTAITNWSASMEYRHILIRNGFKTRGKIRFYFTFIFGGNFVKQSNGWI